ncbi:MAG: hypothetical protein WBL65_14465, partial [Bryobacteraceae bacterium]
STNALRHGLLAKCVVLENESSECFDELVTQHQERFAPADGVEFAMIEEMVAANWRMRRAWAIENRLMEKAIRNQPPGDEAARIAGAFSDLAASPELNLLHRYEARLHRIYQRALENLLVLGEPDLPNQPDPISEQSAPLPQGPGGDVPDEKDLPTPPALRVAADASPPSLENCELPKEPSPISEHQVVHVPGPDPQMLPAPPDSGVADVLVLNYG